MNIDALLAQVKPALDEFRLNPSNNPNYVTMIRLRDRIVQENRTNPIFYSQDRAVEQAGRCIVAMKIDVSDMEDTDKAVEFLFSGFMLMVKLVGDLCGAIVPESLYKACEQVELRC